MKALLLALSLLCAAPAASALDLERQAAAIAQVETGAAWDGRPGRDGELGDVQITSDVWCQHMPGIPFARAREPALARVCALKHLRWINDSLARAGYLATPERIATAWNIGLEGLLRRHGRPTDYGRRVANLYLSKP